MKQNLKPMKTLNTNDLKKKVYVLRNVQVMLDFDLAERYGYEVRVLNQQVKRNITRFPEDFMFQLTKKDIYFIKSQFVILPIHEKRNSPDSFLSLEEIVDKAKRKGLDAICITDHDEKSWQECKKVDKNIKKLAKI